MEQNSVKIERAQTRVYRSPESKVLAIKGRGILCASSSPTKSTGGIQSAPYRYGDDGEV